MRVAPKPPSADKIDTRPTSQATSLPGQIVLVLQGGGALGAYQAGVYQGLHEAGIEPDWIIGTSIGAINASLIAGNEAPNRLPRLEEFWGRMADRAFWHASAAWAGAGFCQRLRQLADTSRDGVRSWLF
jgi:NTE family protein